ncbi:uncharacterized protein BDR25DRAFT_353920 [Lindgomyces ingoldianus]|uniref:Uncharacterized protein n=1 Tax=Lindgomyces ingoldianus TaxID=673940 RepID=A0ACB6QYX1_9PLEO|nr:uncharacterized protein BDR25DRAFT_353920 [Lindgomyces ingoldianus]KAF2472218.1 hypothetical protein BDR25DRAFT_353920 [Lindgomyces ingoldianus]
MLKCEFDSGKNTDDMGDPAACKHILLILLVLNISKNDGTRQESDLGQILATCCTVHYLSIAYAIHLPVLSVIALTIFISFFPLLFSNASIKRHELIWPCTARSGIWRRTWERQRTAGRKNSSSKLALASSRQNASSPIIFHLVEIMNMYRESTPRDPRRRQSNSERKLTTAKNERTAERPWQGDLATLNGDEREWKQMLRRDLSDEEYVGPQHIMNMIDKPTLSEDYGVYVRLVRPFILVTTHSSFLDCLSSNTPVGLLYNSHLCETLVKSQFNAASSPTAVETALDLPTLIKWMKNTAQVVTREAQSLAFPIVLGQIDEIRATVARASRLFTQEGEGQEADFLPSTDLDQLHVLHDQAERHIDTHFRLLRHDTFGESIEALGSLIHVFENDPASLWNPKLKFGDFRDARFGNEHIVSAALPFTKETSLRDTQLAKYSTCSLASAAGTQTRIDHSLTKEGRRSGMKQFLLKRLAAIKQAMVSETRGVATHMGHCSLSANAASQWSKHPVKNAELELEGQIMKSFPGMRIRAYWRILQNMIRI